MLKILVADDSDVVRQLVKTALSGANGWSVCGEAADGQEAVLRARELKPELIVMDLAMPLLDGLHAAAEILKSTPSLPIILYTLHKAPEIELEAKKAGIRAVVSKSDDIKALLDAVEQFAPKTSQIAAMSEELFSTTKILQRNEAPGPSGDESLSAENAESALAAQAGAAAASASPGIEGGAAATPAADNGSSSSEIPNSSSDS